MAEGIQVPGACHVYTDTNSGSFEALGYSINGVEMSQTPFFLNVPGDQNGGDDGPPIDVQYLGEIHYIRMELSKWDPAVADKCICIAKGTTIGQIATPGVLMAGGSKSYKVSLRSTLLYRTYQLAFLRNQIETQRGTKFARLLLEWECHASAGVLYTQTTS
jgi:hypothetical protein